MKPRSLKEMQRDRLDAAHARAIAEIQLHDVQSKWPEVKQGAERAARSRRENHFAQCIKAAFLGGLSDADSS